MSFVYFIVLIGVLIFFHELGHFTAAKAFGVKVLRFALGFGKPIVSVRWGETTYAINWFPLGGYVRMLGQEPAELRTEEPDPEEDMSRAFDRKPRWQRLIVILAGPVFNLILPLPIYFLFLVSEGSLPPATVGSVIPGGPAASAGLRPGDRIVAIDGDPIDYWEQMEQEIASSPGDALQVEVQRGERRLSFELTPEAQTLGHRVSMLSRTVGRIGVTSVFLSSQVGLLDTTSPAANAGLRSGDVIVAAGGQPVRRWVELERAFERHAGQPLALRVRRYGPDTPVPDEEEALFGGGAPLELELAVPPAGTPRSAGLDAAEFFVDTVAEGGAAATAGLQVGDRILAVDGEPCATFLICFRHFQSAPEEPHTVRFVRPAEGLSAPRELRFVAQVERRMNEVKQEEIHAKVGLGNQALVLRDDPVPNRRRIRRALAGALGQNWTMVQVNTLGLVMLFTGQISAKSVGGPIMIFDLARRAARKGWEDFLWLMAVISINLGLINLLPVPILDGGQITFLGIEAVRRGPLSLRVRAIAAYIGLALVVALMGFAFWNDIQRYWGDFVGWLQ